MHWCWVGIWSFDCGQLSSAYSCLFDPCCIFGSTILLSLTLEKVRKTKWQAWPCLRHRSPHHHAAAAVSFNVQILMSLAARVPIIIAVYKYTSWHDTCPLNLDEKLAWSCGRGQFRYEFRLDSGVERVFALWSFVADLMDVIKNRVECNGVVVAIHVANLVRLVDLACLNLPTETLIQ